MRKKANLEQKSVSINVLGKSGRKRYAQVTSHKSHFRTAYGVPRSACKTYAERRTPNAERISVTCDL